MATWFHSVMAQASTFQRVFGRVAALRVQAPGRINLIGEHVDYLEGCVMPAAIDRHLTMEVAPLEQPVIRAWSEGERSSLLKWLWMTSCLALRGRTTGLTT